MEKIKKLKKIFKREKIDGYIIPKNDEFFGEYVSKGNDRLNYITNFTGSYGFSIILKNDNYLFVDGRYTLQAKKESGKSFQIVTIPRILPKDILKKKRLVIGFDPKIFTNQVLVKLFRNTNCKLLPFNKNFIDEIWNRKIVQNKEKFYIFNNDFYNYDLKINKVVNNLKNKGADFQFITSCENNAWLLNIRGKDAEYTPIPHSYVLIDKNKKIKLFCDPRKISRSFKNYFQNIQFLDFKSLNEILRKISKKKFLIDRATCSIFFENIISKNNKILNFRDPIYQLKAIKNRKEIENIKLAHKYDGAALTKYIFWLKKNFNRRKITELSGSRKLYGLRKKNSKFKFLSFPTISGTGPNGAIIHYNPNKKSDRRLKKGDVYLVDSGGQYKLGTTDVTRTVSLKNTNQRVKNIYTRVLKGHIAVANYKLKKKTTGAIIDKQARKYLNQIGLDYSHGTGHGVGYFLNVHEGPQGISKNNKVILKEGMVLSNEPGYYEKNKFGIRIENLIYVKKKKSKKLFENLTMAPIEKELINKKILNDNEKKWLNNYHNKVFRILKKSMNKSEIQDLKKACSAI